MRQTIVVIIMLFAGSVNAQELYVFTEPASNMPSGSVSPKLNSYFIPAGLNREKRLMQRYSPEIMFGLNKNWMLHVSGSFADMHTGSFRWESVYAYAKYRMLSLDEVHRHFRMAAFVEGSYTRSPFEFEEISLQGDKSGVAAGLVATQLIDRIAFSATVSNLQVLGASRAEKYYPVPGRNYQAMNYSFSTGYLLFPVHYTDYRQTNINLYFEVLAQQALDRPSAYLDLAPAIQFIFNSSTKINFGYRFQVAGSMNRMSPQTLLIAFEKTFLR